MNTANTLTTLRLLSAPLLAVIFIAFERPSADFLALVVFLTAAATDWIDGHIARAWKQETRLGAMLDPIADKTTVIIALAIILAYSKMTPWLTVPASIIIFREIFVSGLREFLGDVSQVLRVTKLAKWKTTVQLLAISSLFIHGGVEHYFLSTQLEIDTDGGLKVYDDLTRQRLPNSIEVTSSTTALMFLWIAAALTALTGWDYFKKSLPHMR